MKELRKWEVAETSLGDYAVKVRKGDKEAFFVALSWQEILTLSDVWEASLV